MYYNENSWSSPLHVAKQYYEWKQLNEADRKMLNDFRYGAGFPRFDANRLPDGVTREHWRQILLDPDRDY